MLKAMIAFNNEILRQKSALNIPKPTKYGLNRRRRPPINVPSEDELAKDEDYPVLHERLHRLKTVLLPSLLTLRL